MLKKVILGMGLVGALATAGFSAETKIDNNFCKAYEYSTYHLMVNERYSNAKDEVQIAIQREGAKEGGDTRFNSVYGTLSTDFLKENGIGYSVNMGWGNILVSFNEFLKYAHSDEDKKELRKFMISLAYFSEWKENLIDTKKQTYREAVYNNIEIIYQKHLSGELSENIGGLYLTDTFASSRGKQKEIFSTFAKYVVNKDFVKAKEYIKSTNKKSGINKIYSEFETACEK